ncbi:hypothetical protein [Massilia genomosp. 1]|uniref:Bacterial Pleckstrin homology domain-containing protein n=1 Tax=Massilia genomosp. 1 TaxID=2609280 RepID=A0ABX0MS94_9BURK|nr:hypothetical protein [Massilia genomosp. 1]NHZ65612.1 hypothetical protein [Massilia genomosp. 1]
MIGMLFAVPLLLTTGFYFLTPHTTTPTATETGFVSGMLIASALLGLLVCTSMFIRHSVELTADALVIKHAFYTFRVERACIQGAVITRSGDMSSLAMSTKRNGIAAFGYYSGWFKVAHGERAFMAISGAPVVMLRFTGHPKCALLAVSGSATLEAELAAWLREGSGAPAQGGAGP